MQLLLRKCTLNERGETELSDIELSADQITFGSAPDCDVQLLGENIRARHALLRISRGAARIEAARGCELSYNGGAVARAQLRGGDTLEFGAHRLQVMDAPAGFDLALQWWPGEVDGRLLAQAYRTSLRDTGLRPRLVAWTLAIVVLLLAGAAPVASYWLRQHAGAPSATAPGAAPNPPLVQRADSLWLSGPLHAAHQVALGGRCEGCHQTPFRQVTDDACRGCHKNVADHVDGAHPQHALIAGLHCQNCHKEHNEPETLVLRADSLCVDCHRERQTPVRGFAAGAHPELHPSLLTPAVQRLPDRFEVRWRSERPAEPKENSHLRFSHAAHLDAAKMRAQNKGEPLSCSSCHTLAPDKEHFVPITMEKSCSRCHDLSFDPRQPQKQLPHGDPAAVYDMLEGYFLGRSFGVNKNIADDGGPARRLPAHAAADDSCRGDAACARAKAARETERQFTQRGCVTCHVGETFGGSDPRTRWQVLPVRLTRDFYPDAHFNHAVHIGAGSAQGDAACVGCHRANTSRVSSDVLMPDLKTCLQCHGDAHAAQSFPLQCVSCHAYHPAAAAGRKGSNRVEF